MFVVVCSGHAFGVDMESTTVSCDRCRPAVAVETAGPEAVHESLSIHDFIGSVLMEAKVPIVKEPKHTDHDSVLPSWASSEMLSITSMDITEREKKAEAIRDFLRNHRFK